MVRLSLLLLPTLQASDEEQQLMVLLGFLSYVDLLIGPDEHVHHSHTGS